MSYYIMIFFIGLYYRIIFRLKVEGLENIPKKGALIICSNHVSNIDPFILAIVNKRMVSFIAKKELFENPFLKFILNCLRAFPIDRESGKDIKALKKAMSILKRGKVLGIFFQGTRKQENDFKDAKNGVALFSVKGKAPVVPVGIRATYKPFSEVYIKFGEPLSFEDYYGKKVKQEDLAVITKTITDEVAKLAGV